MVMTLADEQPTPTDSESDGSFRRALGLLEFDEIRRQLAAATRTAVGAEAAVELAPSADPRDVAVRQQETAEARRLLDTAASLELGPADDLRPAVHRAMLGGVLTGEELRNVGALAAAARWNRNALSHREDAPILAAVTQNLPDLPDLESAVNRAIGPAGEVLDNASPELSRLRRDSRASYSALNDVMQRMLRRYQRSGIAQENIVTERNGRMVLLVKNDFKGQAPGIVHDVSDSGATVFVEPMPAIDLGNRWRETRLAEQREEERVLRQLSSLVGRYAEDVNLMTHLLGRLDLAAAKGRYAASLRAVPPNLLDADEPRRLHLGGARHPLLTGDVVPTTIGIDADHPVLLVTGPNAGGKTVALKTVGLLAMMAHAGLQVPANEADLPLFDGIYADIGDQQSIFESLSTFSSHIRNIQRILDVVTPRSLVLIDELGSATDPEEGSALAIALLSHLRDCGATVVATTHHRNVARLAQEEPGMVNASVDLNPRTLEPTYRLTHGVPGRSYALTIASRLGLPETVIAGAQTHLEPSHVQTDRLLQELQEERLTVSELRQQAERALVDARQQEQEIAERLEAVEDTKAQLVEDARRELAEEIAEVAGRIRQAERSLRRQQERQAVAGREAQTSDVDPASRTRAAGRGSAGSGVAGMGADPRGASALVSRPARRRPGVHPWGFPPGGSGHAAQRPAGDRGRHRQYARPGCPCISWTVPPTASIPPAEQAGVVYRRPEAKRTLSPEVNLHGYRVDEALNVIDSLLDDAALEGMTSLKIVHGKGTGALRRRHPRIPDRPSAGGNHRAGGGREQRRG